MKPPVWLNNALLAMYAASGTVLTSLVDAHDLRANTAALIAAGITIFAAGFHGAQAVQAVQAAPAGRIAVAPTAASAMVDPGPVLVPVLPGVVTDPTAVVASA